MNNYQANNGNEIEIENGLMSALTNVRFPDGITVNVLLAILAKTNDGGEEQKAIPMSEFMDAMEFADEKTIQRAINDLESMNAINIRHGKNGSVPIYSIQRDYHLWGV